MTKLILISGKGEAGKTLTANIIKEKLENKGKRVTLLPFAAYLKFICKEHFGWNGNKDLEGRRILQYVGTDVVRKRNPNFWVKTVADFIETFGEDFDFIISDDVRFVNELEYFRDVLVTENLSVRIERLNHENLLTEEQRKHPSETALDDYPFDIYIYSESGLKNLEEALHQQFLDNVGVKEWLGL